MKERTLQLRDAFLWTKDMLYKLKVLVALDDIEKLPEISGQHPMARVHQDFLDKRKAKLDILFAKNKNKRRGN